MTEHTILVTGFPGFIGNALLERLVEARDERTAFVSLVEHRYIDRAKRVLSTFDTDDRARISIRPGDITKPYLRLGDAYVPLTKRVDEIFHLAAAYALGVDDELAPAVNVEGTRHLLAFARRCETLRRFHHMSTCYVSGRYDGRFTESDVPHDATFNNAYERSKHLAEAAVREEADDEMAVTIYRPSIVVGDTSTGYTQKYDGLYFLLRLLEVQPPVAFVPRIGDPDSVEFNVVPRDYVVDAMVYLSSLDESAGETYHLCDPNPPSVARLFGLCGRATGRMVLQVPVPKKPFETAVTLGRYFGMIDIDPAAIDYLDLPTTYTAAKTRRALSDTSISPPPLSSYLDELVTFMRAHPTPPTTPADLDGQPSREEHR